MFEVQGVTAVDDRAPWKESGVETEGRDFVTTERGPDDRARPESDGEVRDPSGPFLRVSGRTEFLGGHKKEDQ